MTNPGDTPRQTDMFAGYAHGDSTRLFHFYPHPRLVKFCGCERVFRVLVQELPEETDGCYWAWWDLDNQGGAKFSLVYPKKLLLEMCFPYGLKAEEERGKGLALPVSVTVVEEITD